MAVAAILDPRNFALLDREIDIGCARSMLLLFGENCFIQAKNNDIFEIQYGGRRHLGFWKICMFAPGDRYRLVPSVCCSNMVSIASSLWWILESKMAAAAIFDFGKFASPRIVKGYCQVYAVEIW